jgi:hypothetical protein
MILGLAVGPTGAIRFGRPRDGHQLTIGCTKPSSDRVAVLRVRLWNFVLVDAAVFPPRLRQQPCPRNPHDQRPIARGRPIAEQSTRERLPPEKRDAARVRIELPRASEILAVTPPVVQYVRDARAHLAGRRQHRRVIAIAKHASPATDRAIDQLCRRDQEALHALRERGLARRLDDQVKVRALDAQVHDASTVVVLRDRDGRVANARVEVAAAQVADAWHDARDDVDRRSRRKRESFLVPLAWSIAHARPASTSARAAAPLPILVATQVDDAVRSHARTLVLRH